MAKHYSGCMFTNPDCLCMTCKKDGSTEPANFCCDGRRNNLLSCKVKTCPDYEKEDDSDVQSAIPAER